ncbi:amino acid ABC transporter substrate-binding protein [Alicyclobacillus contaminans]|uniref:transporter substrate-binding domain-containing protein n=1 Tax=Alicyclobacillus contaminans TaxID=392016 RepID=UPI000405FD61|nr:transporter substrate-binding domain-containing protein [Alicyclobacillus contaminans]GMA51251.1 amino acid ABC transporter substrate-binding protein [Alicyclobacillus contaminans]
MKTMHTWMAAGLLALTVAGCGTAAGNTASQSGGQEGKAAAVQTVVVGTSPNFPKVTYYDENGKLTGFDIELVRDIDQLLPDYQFKFQTMDFANLLLSLQTHKIDMIANEMEINPERQQKYLFNKVPYAYWQTKIIVAKGNNSIHSLDDLVGKKVLTTATTAEADILQNYNQTHSKKIDIVYENGNANDTVSEITSGRVVASLGADFSLPLIDPEHKLTSTGAALAVSPVDFVFRKNDPAEQKLANEVDQALQKLIANGTLSKLSIQWLGSDFTKNIPQHS